MKCRGPGKARECRNQCFDSGAACFPIASGYWNFGQVVGPNHDLTFFFQLSISTGFTNDERQLHYSNMATHISVRPAGLLLERGIYIRLFKQCKVQSNAGFAPSSKSYSTTKSKVTYKDLWNQAEELHRFDKSNDRTLGNTQKKFLMEEESESKPATSLYSRADILEELSRPDEKVKSGVFSLGAPSSKGSPPVQEIFNTQNSVMAFLDDPLKSSNVLYVRSGDLSLVKEDFDNLISNSVDLSEDYSLLGSGLSEKDPDLTDYIVIRSRHPDTLIKWIGYFLIFPTREAALKFHNAVSDANLCGQKISLDFVDPSKPNIHPPSLYEVPGVTRSMCALVSGLPSKMSSVSVERALFDYDLIADHKNAIVKLTGDKYQSESSWLIRFKNDNEPKRLRKKYHRRQWPGTNLLSSVEVLD